MLGLASGLGSNCAFEAGGKCFTAPFSPTPLTEAQCEAEKDKLGIKYCGYDTDYWAGAVKQCGGVSKMPTMADLGKLATELYKEHPSVGGKQDIDSGLTLDTSKASSLGFTGTSFYVWSGEENGNIYAYDRYFSSSYTYWYNGRRYSDHQALCIGD